MFSWVCASLTRVTASSISHRTLGVSPLIRCFATKTISKARKQRKERRVRERSKDKTTYKNNFNIKSTIDSKNYIPVGPQTATTLTKATNNKTTKERTKQGAKSTIKADKDAKSSNNKTRITTNINKDKEITIKKKTINQKPTAQTTPNNQSIPKLKPKPKLKPEIDRTQITRDSTEDDKIIEEFENSAFKEPENEQEKITQAIPYATWFFAHKCELEKITGKMTQVPKHALPQVAFVGRSNAGKSSLLNALISSANGKLARVSGSPGCTQTINFYNMYQRLMLLDLPGYGYAKVPMEVKRGWLDFVSQFLADSPNLKRTFVLIDSRRGVTHRDHEFLEQLEECGKKFQIILTKVDRGSNSREQVEAVAQETMKYKNCVSGVLLTSAKRKFGLGEVKACCLLATGLAKLKKIDKQQEQGEGDVL